MLASLPPHLLARVAWFLSVKDGIRLGAASRSLSTSEAWKAARPQAVRVVSWLSGPFDKWTLNGWIQKQCQQLLSNVPGIKEVTVFGGTTYTPTIEKWHPSGCRIPTWKASHLDSIAIANAMLCSNSPVIGFYVSNAHVAALAPMLRAKLTLKYLSFIYFSDEAAADLAAVLPETSIEKLFLSYCDIGDKGARALAAVLHRAPKLRHLDLAHNKISDDGAKALAEARQNTAIILKINNNRITADVKQMLAAKHSGDLVIYSNFAHNVMIINNDMAAKEY